MRKEQLEDIYRKGYRVDDFGRVRSPSGGIRKTRVASNGYQVFNMKVLGRAEPVSVHRLAAFQKFGSKYLLDGVEARHIDGNCQNNSLSNISIGSRRDNKMDVLPSDRVSHAMKASRARRKLSDDQVKRIIESDESLSTLASRLGVVKSTVANVRKRRLYREVIERIAV